MVKEGKYVKLIRQLLLLPSVTRPCQESSDSQLRVNIALDWIVVVEVMVGWWVCGARTGARTECNKEEL